MPTAQSYLYCSESDVKALLSSLGVDARLDDDGSGTLDAAESPALRTCREWATAKINAYCRHLYEPSDLANDWLVNQWATVFAGGWLCSRRMNAVPDSIQALADEAKAELAKVQVEQLRLPGIAKRNVDWPAWSNVRVDPGYRLKQVRVQRPISEGTPTQYSQHVDWRAEYTWEW